VTAVELFLRLFLNRADALAFAPPWNGDACRAVPGDGLSDLLAAHVSGELRPVTWANKEGKGNTTQPIRIRHGSYAPAIDGTTRWGCADFDGGGRHAKPLKDPLGAALEFWENCKRAGLTPYLERSGGGKGWHVWVFFGPLVPAALVRKVLFALPTEAELVGGGMADATKNEGIEVFPKQDAIDADGFGNMVWLPWWHGATDGGNVFYEVADDGELRPYLPDGFDLTTAETLQAVFDSLAVEAPPPPRAKPFRGYVPPTGDQRPSAEFILKKYIGLAHTDRNDNGFGLGCQLRDNGYSQNEARAFLLEYQSSVHQIGHAYTVKEALATLRSVYSRPPREPWGHRTTAALSGGSATKVPPTGGTSPPANTAAGRDEARPDPGDEGKDKHPAGFSNYFIEVVVRNDRTVPVKIGYPINYLGDWLRDLTGGWTKRVGPLPFVAEGDAPLYLETPAQAFAWIGRQMPNGDRNQLRWVTGDDKVGRDTFYAHLQQTGDCFDAVESFPHWPQLGRHYYLHRRLEGGDGSALRTLLERFNPATPIDADLLLAFYLSTAAGLPPGTRPAWLFTAEDGDDRQGRGVGKTAAVEINAELFGGYVAVSANDDMADVKKRLLSPEARGKRVVLVDNIKTLKFSWDELEALVTGTIVSGRQLYVGEGCIPNTFTICLTLNGATLSKDMAQRCVIVKLARPVYSATWREDTVAFVRDHRWAILGDIVAALQAPVAPLTRFSRWGLWEAAVLARLPEPADAQKVIEERQAEVDDDREESELVREAFVNELKFRGHNPDQDAIFIPSKVAAQILLDATNERRPTNKASAHLKTLGISELRKSDRDQKGWVWTGKRAAGKPASRLWPRPAHHTDDSDGCAL
jgi:hypothetical protein